MAITVGDPIGLALTRTELVLFKPFKLKRWMALAVGPALMLVGEGMSPLVNVWLEQVIRNPPRMTLEKGLNWIAAHTAGLLWGILGIVLVAFPIYLWIRWVNARGHFIFFDSLVRKEARVKVPWREFRALGNSLMKLRIWWDLVLFNVFLVMAVIAGALEWPDFKQFLMTNEFKATGWTTGAVIFLAVAMVFFAIAWWVASSVVFHLAIPVMYVRRMEAWPAVKLAWRELFLRQKGACLRYFLFLIVVAALSGAIVEVGMVVISVMTLCLGCAATFVPIVGNFPPALAGLPASAFEAAYKLHFVGQFGPEYAVAWSGAVSPNAGGVSAAEGDNQADAS